NIDRRQFLGMSASAVLAATAGQGRAADDDFGGFTLGVQSYSFRNFDLEPALKRIQDLGLKHAEFYQKHVPLQASPEQIKAFQKLCGDYGVKPVCWGVQSFTKNHDANKKVFEFGKALGLKSFSANPNPDAFDSLDKLCDEYKIAIGIHPHGPVGGNKLDRWYSAEIIMAAVKDHNPLIGACLDTGHLIRCAQLDKKLDPAQQVRVMGARNFGMHLKDHDNKTKRDVVFGKGSLDVAAVLKALRDSKFTGHISIEYEANPDNPSPDMKDCVQVFKDAIKKLG
ncbi:MAG: sugar phosphate isomerase/epimerase family protein, partial [Gemmataceae bacterium]